MWPPWSVPVRWCSVRPNKAESLLKLIGVLAAFAVLAAGVLLPYVGGLGLVAGRESAKFLTTKCNLQETPPAQKTVMYANDGKTELATLYTYDRELVSSLSDIPKYLQQALIATEDRRFYSHHGVDMRGLLRSAINSSSGDTQGGSTLTMQYVKQVRYYQADTDAERQAAISQTLTRKMEDAKCALDIEKRESKDQILLNYLNIAFFGENSYGIGTAAKNFFGVPVDKLTLPQAALLVGVVKAPSEYDPFVPANRKAAIERRNQVIQNLADTHDISQAEADRYKAAPLSLATTTQQSVSQGCAGANPAIMNAGFFCDYVRSWLENTGGMTDKQINTGGYKIVTTISPSLQNQLQQSLSAQIPANSKTTAIMPVVDPRSGNVLAMATSKRYGIQNDGAHTTLPVFTSASAGGGSTYKLFSLLAALKVGVPTDTRISAGPDMTYTTAHCGTTGFTAQNDSEGTGFTRTETLASATAKSSNTYFVALEDNLFQQCELTPYVDTALDLGMNELKQPDPNAKKGTLADSIIKQQQATFTLGPAPTSPLQLTGAYAAVANDGTFCPPAPVLSIKGPSGKDLDFNRTPCSQKMAPQVARIALSVLSGDTHDPGTSAPAFASLYGVDPGITVAGKTGTVNASKNGKQLTTNADLWFAGVTPNYVATTALFNIDNPNKPIVGIPGMTDDAASHLSGEFAAQIWVNTMTPVLSGQQWAWPDPNDVQNPQAVPSVIGQPYDEARTTLTQDGFKVVRSAIDCGSSEVYGDVAYQSPTNVAPAGSTITVCVSNNQPLPLYVPPKPKPKPKPTKPTVPVPTRSLPPGGGGGGGGRHTRPPGGVASSIASSVVASAVPTA
jgi:membrane peptidoglycan carboxypeptidase